MKFLFVHCFLWSIFATVAAAKGACVSIFLYQDSDSCKGTPKVASFPVGTKPLENCTSSEMDGIGIFSADWYCEFPQEVTHQGIFYGDSNCDKENATMVMEQTMKTFKCIGLGPGISVWYECIDGSCPHKEASVFDEEEEVARAVLSDAHRAAFASATTQERVQEQQEA